MFEFIKKLADNFKSADMEIAGNMLIGTLQKDFRNNFGLYLRVYKGNSFANPDITISKLNQKTSTKINTTADNFSVKASMKVGDVEKTFMDSFGLKVQVAEFYNRHLVSDNFTLGENARRKGEDLDCEKKYGMSSMDYIKSKGYDDLNSWVKYKYADKKIGNSDFVGKMRGVFSLNHPHLFISFDNNKTDEGTALKELNKLSEIIVLTNDTIGNLKVIEFQKSMKSLLNCKVEIFYQKKAKAHYKKVTEIDSNITISDAEELGAKKNWSDWSDWALDKAVKYN